MTSRGKYMVELCKSKEIIEDTASNVSNLQPENSKCATIDDITSVINPDYFIPPKQVPSNLVVDKSSDKWFDIINLPVDFLSEQEWPINIVSENEFSENVASENAGQSTAAISVPVDFMPECEFPGDSPNNSTSKKTKLVDYDSSTDTSSSQKGTVRKQQTKKVKLRRFNSTSTNYSNYNDDNDLNVNLEDHDFSYDEDEVNQEADDSCVGELGKRKTRKKSKKYIKKMEKNFGFGKTLQPNPCRNKRCQYNCAKKFTEQERYNIFEFYWGLGSYQRQRDWLLSCVKEAEIKRRRAGVESSRRNRTFNYLIPWEGQEIQVCQQFLLKTLDISQMTVRYTINCAIGLRVAKVDHRGKHEPFNKTQKGETEYVHTFIKKLPAVPSHYCRNSTTKKYLPSELRNISFLYRIFKEDQKTLGWKKTVSLQVFRRIFLKDFNIGFHLPKKDKCSLCEQRKDPEFQSNEKDTNLFEKHCENKNNSKTLFINDQEKAKNDSTFVCASFDLQKVLGTPHGDNILLYYSRKYAYYNETVYESGNRNTFCFLWGEKDGKRGCTEICTIMFKYLQEVDGRGGIKEVALYCDSCSGQNKNKAMISMIYYFVNLSVNITTVKIVYLLPGHTYMPVDSVHAGIERFIRKRIIWAPSGWPAMVENARVNPKPYDVVKLEYSDFLNWNIIAEEVLPAKLKKTKEGNKIEFNKIRVFSFHKGFSEIKVKHGYTAEDKELTIPITKINKGNLKPSQLYFSTLPISNLKYNNLKTLCDKNVIPNLYKDEFIKLKHKGNVPDVLAETDEEDQEEESRIEV